MTWIDLSNTPTVGNGDTFTVQWSPSGWMNITIDHVAVWDATEEEPMCDHDTCWENLG